MKALNEKEYKERLREVYGDSRALLDSYGRIITQEQLAEAIGDVLDNELTPHLPIGTRYDLNIEVRQPGECFVDIGLVPREPESRWKRLMQRIGLWFLRRAE